MHVGAGGVASDPRHHSNSPVVVLNRQATTPFPSGGATTCHGPVRCACAVMLPLVT